MTLVFLASSALELEDSCLGLKLAAQAIG